MACANAARRPLAVLIITASNMPLASVPTLRLMQQLCYHIAQGAEPKRAVITVGQVLGLANLRTVTWNRSGARR